MTLAGLRRRAAISVRGRSGRIAVILLAGLAGLTGCDATGPTSPAPERTPSPQATTAVPSETLPPYPIATFDESNLRSVTLDVGFQVHRASSDGPRLVFDQLGYGDDARRNGRSMFLADLERGSLTEIATADDGDAAWSPDIDQDHIVWVEWRYPDDNTNFVGDCHWKIVAFNTVAQSRTVLLSGVHQRLTGQAAPPPIVRVDGDHVAYAVEDPGPGRPWGWRIVVVSLGSGSVVREIQTAGAVYLMDLSGDDVAWTEGEIDEAIGFTHHTRLMLARGDEPPVEIATDAFEVVVDDGRLAWAADPGSSQGASGLAQHPRIFTASLASPRPVAVSHESGPLVKGSHWPQTGDGAVVWSDDQETGVNPPQPGNRLVIWTAESQQAYEVHGATTILPFVGGGWIVWYDDAGDEPYRINGLRLSDLHLP